MRPDIPKDDPTAQWSRDQLKFSPSEALYSHISDAGENILDEISNVASEGVFSVLDPNDPVAKSLGLVPPPATPTEIDTLKKGRPGLEFPKDVNIINAHSLAEEFDTKARNQLVQNHVEPTLLGVAANYGGSLIPAFTDPLFLSGAGFGESLATKFIEPGVKKALTKIGADELFGASTSQTIEKLTNATISGSTSMGLGQAFTDASNISEKFKRNEPVNWLAATTDVGKAFGLGALLGPVFNVGKILKGKAFDTVNQVYKNHIENNWMPWTKNSNDVAKVDAAGQSIDGREPNVQHTLQQGMADQGKSFRDQTNQAGINKDDMVKQLNEARIKAESQAAAINAMKGTPQEFKDFANNLANTLQKNPDLVVNHDEMIKQFKDAHPNIPIDEQAIRDNLPLPDVEPRDVSLQGEYERVKANNAIESQISDLTEQRLKHEQDIRDLEQQHQELMQQAKEISKTDKGKKSTLLKTLSEMKGRIIYLKNLKIDVPKIDKETTNYQSEVHDLVKERVKSDSQINQLKKSIKSAQKKAERLGSKDLINNVDQLKNKLNKAINNKVSFPSLDEELEQIRNNIFDEFKNTNRSFRNTKNYKRLVQMATGNNRARNLLLETHLRHEPYVNNLFQALKDGLLDDLLKQHTLTRSVVAQLEDEIKNLDRGDIKNYFNHLESNGIVPDETVLPGEKEQTIDEALSNYDDKVIQDIVERSGSSEISDEIKKAESDIKQMPIYRKMIDEMIGCKRKL